MAANNKTEVISAADFQASKGRKSAVKKPGKRTVFPISGTGAVYELVYSGAGLSSNKWYAGMHWTKRQKLKDEWRSKFHPLISAANMAGMGGMQAMRLRLTYRSRFDADNTTAMIKLLVDQLKGWFIPDDTPAHFRGFSVEYDGSLPHNTFVFAITELV